MSEIEGTEILSEKGKVLYLMDGFKFLFHKNFTNNIDRYCTYWYNKWSTKCISFTKMSRDNNFS